MQHSPTLHKKLCLANGIQIAVYGHLGDSEPGGNLLNAPLYLKDAPPFHETDFIETLFSCQQAHITAVQNLVNQRKHDIFHMVLRGLRLFFLRRRRQKAFQKINLLRDSGSIQIDAERADQGLLPVANEQRR